MSLIKLKDHKPWDVDLRKAEISKAGILLHKENPGYQEGPTFIPHEQIISAQFGDGVTVEKKE